MTTLAAQYGQLPFTIIDPWKDLKTKETNKVWTIRISEEVANRKLVHVYDNFGREVATEIKISGQQITTRPLTSFVKVHMYQLIIGKGLQGAENTVLKADICSKFEV
ncbi:hypothetical protein [Solibacillus sp. FSL H8-0538]|uniref:hypothetical protein n=1 Tax=Solibacillus sp. FSL H8-0538 TaxID=2921400 RepID=UPI0030F9DD97